jgi:hypothetical protein
MPPVVIPVLIITDIRTFRVEDTPDEWIEALERELEKAPEEPDAGS